MRKQKITVLILMITLCLTGIWGMKKKYHSMGRGDPGK